MACRDVTRHARTWHGMTCRRRASLVDGRDVDMETLMRRVFADSSIGDSDKCVLDFLLFRDIVQVHTCMHVCICACNTMRPRLPTLP